MSHVLIAAGLGPFRKMPFLVTSDGFWHIPSSSWAGLLRSVPAGELTAVCDPRRPLGGELVVASRYEYRPAHICMVCTRRLEGPFVFGSPTSDVWSERFACPTPEEDAVISRTISWFDDCIAVLSQAASSRRFIIEDVRTVDELACEMVELRASPLLDQQMRDDMRSLFSRLVVEVLDLQVDVVWELPALTWFASRTMNVDFYRSVGVGKVPALRYALGSSEVVEGMDRVFSAADRDDELRLVAEEWAERLVEMSGSSPAPAVSVIAAAVEGHVEHVVAGSESGVCETVLFAAPFDADAVVTSTFESSVLALVWEKYGLGSFSEPSENLDWWVLRAPKCVTDWVVRGWCPTFAVHCRSGGVAFVTAGSSIRVDVGADTLAEQGPVIAGNSFVCGEALTVLAGQALVALLREGVSFADAYAACLALQ